MAFTGQLNSNEIFSALYNMIISVQAFGDNIAGTYETLADKFRVDGSMYGDQKLYVATDALKSAPWGNDAEAQNLLATHRPPQPSVQAVELDTFRQISLTVDDYMSKRAWGNEGAFAQFNSVLMGWIGDTKRIYDSTMVNTYVGTAQSNIGKQTQTIQVTGGATEEETNKLVATEAAKKLADILVELADVTREYNDYGYIRSYKPEDLMVIWNSEVYNAVTKLGEPLLFHKDGLFDKVEKHVLPGRYFGTVNGAGGTAPSANGTVRALVEKDFGGKHCFPGDLLPAGASYQANETYTVAGDIAFKIVHKNSIPFMSAFEVGTSFFNPKSLTENHYLTFGHNTLEYLKNYPMITVTYQEN